MRICFIEDTRLHGGTQIWVSEAVRDFLGKGHDVTLLTAEGGFNATDGVDTDARVVTYDFDAVVSEDGKHRRLWTEALADSDVAVCTVHPPRDGFHCSLFAAKCIEEAGLRTMLLPKTGTIVPEYERELYRPSEKIRSRVICITGFTREYMIETYGIPEQLIALIYQGTDVATFTPSAERQAEALRRYPLPEGAGPVLGNVGSFEPRKGQEVLLRALAKAREELPQVHLLLVGDGPDEETLKRRVTDSALDANVTFAPFTREPVNVFEVIDVLVLSSLYKEGLPNVLLESLSMSRPVIASRLAGVPEAVVEGQTGLMVEPGDVDGLAQAIVKLGSDPDARQSMGEAGRRLMQEHFDKQRQFDRFLDYFTQLAATD